MPVTFEPLENGRIFFFTVSDPWKIEDLTAWYPIIQPYFDHASGKVHTILDLFAMKKIAPGALRARHTPTMEHPNSGISVFVGGSGFARSLAEITFQLSGNRRLKFMDDMQQALAFLRTQIEIENKNKGSING